MKITILGSGTSHGVPMIGCECSVCRSTNPKNRRFRSSIIVQSDLWDWADLADLSGLAGSSSSPDLPEKSDAPLRTILIDTTPELRLQSLSFGVTRVDAVLFTHTHADHVMGLDDLRRFNEMLGAEIPVYGDKETLEDIRRIYPYIFRETLQLGGGKPRLALHEVERTFSLFGLNIRSFYVMHGKLPVLAYRFDQPAIAKRGFDAPLGFAYVTDVNYIPDEAMAQLQGLDLLILDAVRFEPHTTHYGLYEALEVIKDLKPKRTLLTHLSHHFDHDTVNEMLPDGVRLAYDGQTITL